MKSIKRLSVLVALILCVTVGGVYAVWNYAGTDVSDITSLQSAVLTEAVISDSIGTYTVKSNTLALEIDNAGEFVAELDIKGELVLSFKVNANAPLDAENYGINTYLSFSRPTDSGKYEGKDIFTCPSGDAYRITISPENTSDAIKWTKVADGEFECTITAQNIIDKNLIQLGNFVLDSKAKYNAFNEVLTGVNLHISDGITAVAS